MGRKISERASIAGNGTFTAPAQNDLEILAAVITTDATAGNRQLLIDARAVDDSVVAASQTEKTLLAGGRIVQVEAGKNVTVRNGVAGDTCYLLYNQVSD